jgi:hypothetical protein
MKVTDLVLTRKEWTQFRDQHGVPRGVGNVNLGAAFDALQAASGKDVLAVIPPLNLLRMKARTYHRALLTSRNPKLVSFAGPFWKSPPRKQPFS